MLEKISAEIKVPINYTQPSESTPAKTILVHVPKLEAFISSLNPAASLYEDVTDEEKVYCCFLNLKKYLLTKNIKLITVEEALSLDKNALKNLAESVLKYEIKIDPSINKEEFSEEAKKNFIYNSSEKYKKDVISKLSETQLIKLILTQPTCILKPTNNNTFIETSTLCINALGNLVFCRDQQITTKKGVVIGRSDLIQRKNEHRIMKQVFKNIGAKIIGEVPEGALLEGGDFYVAKENLSMLGVGLRTNVNGANYLMENDLLSTQYMAICYDETDLDQQRMHLDTYFNILNDENVICLDFEQAEKVVGKNLMRKVYLYDNESKENIKSDKKEVLEKVGKYQLIKIFDNFYDFLKYENFKIIKVTHEQQVDYMINFLNIGNNTIISVNKDLQNVIKDTGVKSDYLDFNPVLKMYGAMHCMTQVSRS